MVDTTRFPTEIQQFIRAQMEQAIQVTHTHRALTERATQFQKVCTGYAALLEENHDLQSLALDDSDHELIGTVQDVLSQITLSRLTDLATRSATHHQALEQATAATARTWSDLTSFMDKGWCFHIQVLLRDSTVIRSLSNDINDTDVAKTLDSVRHIAAMQSRDVLKRFPQLLDQACADADLPLDRTHSRHPHYSFADGFFRLKINEANGIAYLTDYESKLADFPADIGAIVETVEREYQRVFNRPFDGSKFLAKIRRNYLAVIRKEQKVEGDPIPIRMITKRLGKNESGFRTDEFLIDLSRLIEHGPIEIDNRRLDFQHTKDTTNGMLLHGRAGQGYIGYVLFRKVL